MVPTVERGFFEVDFWSIDTAGDRPSMKSTSGLAIGPRNWRAAPGLCPPPPGWPAAGGGCKTKPGPPPPGTPAKPQHALARPRQVAATTLWPPAAPAGP